MSMTQPEEPSNLWELSDDERRIVMALRAARGAKEARKLNAYMDRPLAQALPSKQAEETRRRKRRHFPEVETILQEVADKHGITVAAIRGPRRPQKYVLARREAVWRVQREIPEMNLMEVARALNKDHTTIIYAIRQHAKTMEMAA